MSSREPMWYCHQRAEMRPLMVPDPHCASCNSTFVEQIESLDDPRDQAIPNFPHQPAQGRNQSFSDAPFGGSGSGDNPLLDIISLLAGPGSFPPARSATSPNTRPMGSGVRIELSSGNNGRSRRVVFGGPPTMGFPAPPGSGADHSMHDYYGSNGRRGDTSGNAPLPDSTLLHEYLLAMLGNRMGAGSGGSNGRMGDYVFSQEGLEQIMNQLMENGSKPVPLAEPEIDKLPRRVLDSRHPLLGKDCQICQDTFIDRNTAMSVDGEPDSAGMKITVELPCHHSFHEDCIVPWLKQSGTCPVCRHALTPQPTPHGPPGPGSPSRSNPSSSSPRGESGSGSGSGSSAWSNFLSFNPFGSSSGNGTSSGTGRNATGSRPHERRRSSNGNRHQNPSNIPGGWDAVD